MQTTEYNSRLSNYEFKLEATLYISYMDLQEQNEVPEWNSSSMYEGDQ